MNLIQELAGKVPVRRWANALGIPRPSLYRLSKPVKKKDGVGRKSPPRALSQEEALQVKETLHSPRFRDASPAHVWATLLEEGVYLCGVRTMYRILDRLGENKERRRVVRHRDAVKPELLATGPNQVWSWDITALLGPAKWSYFYLYVLLDIFSRYVVGWLIADRQTGALARKMIEDSVAKQQVEEGQLIIHNDRGSPMKSKPVAHLLADLGLTQSWNRPYVSNDNPFSESQFKTMKYCSNFPQRFGSLTDAYAFGRMFFSWYNNEHKHSGLGYHTPLDVHYGRAAAIREVRQRTLNQAYLTHPERFVRKPPEAPVLPTTVWINPPTDPGVGWSSKPEAEMAPSSKMAPPLPVLVSNMKTHRPADHTRKEVLH